jgi:predicted nuclease of predicted toxin-antitoxin system
VRFLIDAQLPPAFAESFRREGHDGIPVRDVGLRDASDGEI